MTPKCKDCIREEQRYVYKMRKKHGDSFTLRDSKRPPDGKAECKKCGEIKDKTDFYKDSTKSSGVHSYCKDCFREMKQRTRREKGEESLRTRREWASKNRERLREQDRLYRERNRDRRRTSEQRRRARKAGLPDTLSSECVEDILSHFNEKCAICDSPAETLDHFIPLSSGHGGTVKENIIPLCRKMNASKHGRNPFIWAEDYLSEEQQERFDEVVKYLADLNELTVEEYREFVFSCFTKTA